MAAPKPKSLAFLCRRAPWGSGHAAEMLEAVLIAGAFDQEVHLAFLDDGVFQLVSGQKPELLGRRPLEEGFSELADLDVENVWVEQESLAERGIDPATLTVQATVIDRKEMSALLARMDAVFSA
ncbi:MAG TPA: sulfurtransferase complex subunit TusC [Magnetospirillaceae bacterium]|jgi:tRNA 2-thiouridine synthesizing protein C